MTEVRGGPGNRSAYSLLELMVAMAILSILVVLLAQVINSVSQVITKATDHMQCDTEAQVVFDRLSDDIAQVINRSDVDALFIGMPNVSSTNRNDQMYFYSQGPGFATNAASPSQVSIIGYRINNRSLERLGVLKSWDDLPYLTPSNSQTGFVATNPLQNLGAATNYFHVIAPSIFRMEVALLMKVGSRNPDGTVNQPNSYANLTNSTNYWHGLTNVMAIVVALGILDQTSRKVVTTQQLDALAASLPDSSTNGGVSIATWTSMAMTTTNIPPSARSQIRIYQRSFPVKR